MVEINDDDDGGCCFFTFVGLSLSVLLSLFFIILCKHALNIE